MNNIVQIEKVVAWNQREEPKRGAHIVTGIDTGGFGWAEHEQGGVMGSDHKSGIYLGDHLVACVEVKVE